MPYIPPHRRISSAAQCKDSAELSYHLYQLLVHYTQHNGEFTKTVSDALGALELAKAEYFSNYASPLLRTKEQIFGSLEEPCE